MVAPAPATQDPAPRRARRPPRSPNVVWDLDLPEEIDWSSWHLTDEDDMGQSPRQNEVIFTFSAVARARLEELGQNGAYVGADAFFGWVPAAPLVRVSPDVYVLPRRPEPLPGSFQTWLPGVSPPLLALEVVSEDWKKDYEASPQKYGQLGAGELVIFDPDVLDRDVREPSRVPIQVFRRSEDGLFARVYQGPGPAPLRSLEAFAVVAQRPGAPVLRLAYDEPGRRLVPTRAERAAAERDEAARERDEAARQRDEAARQRDEELARRLALEARLAELEADRDPR